jgi:hypothetical protein
MSRVTAPISKLSRSINSAAAGHGNAFIAHNPGAVLMPKYDELLRNRRNMEPVDVSRLFRTTPDPILHASRTPD